ncbi:hypothetical protein [Streptomyces spectabilis]|uniref:Uncharacterized protein n=1 Tax=Streptomyces spectabilis TaxID=68270 RepID=A0A7W8B1Y1_STRST|nr:hypothetical protein [Streptomyces spectabilis]MBB5107183.1 hypothetical protein [Streptomyces spectabilis]MCI3906229.1 hypothetical protein [Streptomyces spectabilis]GGV04017.1 hypothetical protein GCM10010245_08950 [Streptomyces spectabilis]
MRGPVLVCFDAECRGGAGEAWRECADVLYGSRPYGAAEVPVVAGRLLRRYPGCALVALRVRGGGRVAVERGGARRSDAGGGGVGALLAFAVAAHGRLVQEESGGVRGAAASGGGSCRIRRVRRSTSGAPADV